MSERDENLAPRTADTLRFTTRLPDQTAGSPASVLLGNFISAMYQSGDDAERDNQAALKRLRERPAEIVVEIAQSFQCCRDDDYQTRFALVYAAAQMKHTAALPFLANLVLTPIPAEKSGDPHSFSTVAEETILRTTAVEGVRQLALEDHRDAVDGLFEFLKQPSLSIRRAAVQSLLAVKRDAATRKKITALLPEEHRFLLDVKAVDVRDVPQVKHPERHLSKPRRRSTLPAPPRLPGEDGPEECESNPVPKTHN